jgi:hypothetical protein
MASPLVTVEFLEFGGGVLGLGVDVVPGAELAGERLFVLAAGDADGLEAHLGGILDAEVAEAAEAEDGDDVAGLCAAVAQGVEGRDAGAHERGGLLVGQVARAQGDGTGGRDHVVGISAVEGDAGDLGADAGKEVAAAAGVAVAAVPAVPADADALAGFPADDAGADGVDHADQLMARDARVLNAGEQAVFGHRVAVADAAGVYLDPHGAGGWLGDIALDDFKGAFGMGDLDGTHLGHDLLLFSFYRGDTGPRTRQEEVAASFSIPRRKSQQMLVTRRMYPHGGTTKIFGIIHFARNGQARTIHDEVAYEAAPHP